MEGTQPHPSTANWIKDLQSMALPIRTGSSFPLSQSFPSGSFHKPLILIHQRTGRLKTSITENKPNWSHGPQTCLTQWNYERAMPWRAIQDRQVMLEHSDKTWSTAEGNGKPLQYSCLENPMNSMKRQNDRILKGELPRLVAAHMLQEISGAITPERMKGCSQSKNNTQLWM